MTHNISIIGVLPGTPDLNAQTSPSSRENASEQDVETNTDEDGQDPVRYFGDTSSCGTCDKHHDLDQNDQPKSFLISKNFSSINQESTKQVAEALSPEEHKIKNLKINKMNFRNVMEEYYAITHTQNLENTENQAFFWNMHKEELLSEYLYEKKELFCGFCYISLKEPPRLKNPFILEEAVKILMDNSLDEAVKAEKIGHILFFLEHFKELIQNQNKKVMDEIVLIEEFIEFFYKKATSKLKTINEISMKTILEKTLAHEDHFTKVESSFDKWGGVGSILVFMYNLGSDLSFVFFQLFPIFSASSLFFPHFGLVLWCISLVLSGLAWGFYRSRSQTYSHEFLVYQKALRTAVQLIQKNFQPENKDWFSIYFSEEVIAKINELLFLSPFRSIWLSYAYKKIFSFFRWHGYVLNQNNPTEQIEIEDIDCAHRFKKILSEKKSSGDLIESLVDFINLKSQSHENHQSTINSLKESITEISDKEFQQKQIHKIHSVVFIHKNLRGTLLQHLSLVLNADQMKKIYELAPFSFVPESKSPSIQDQNFLDIIKNNLLVKEISCIFWINRKKGMQQLSNLSNAIHFNSNLSQQEKVYLFTEIKNRLEKNQELNRRKQTLSTDFMAGLCYLGFAATQGYESCVGYSIAGQPSMEWPLLTTFAWFIVTSMPGSAEFLNNRFFQTRSAISAKQFIERNVELCTMGSSSVANDNHVGNITKYLNVLKGTASSDFSLSQQEEWTNALQYFKEQDILDMILESPQMEKESLLMLIIDNQSLVGKPRDLEIIHTHYYEKINKSLAHIAGEKKFSTSLQVQFKIYFNKNLKMCQTPAQVRLFMLQVFSYLFVANNKLLDNNDNQNEMASSEIKAALQEIQHFIFVALKKAENDKSFSSYLSLLFKNPTSHKKNWAVWLFRCFFASFSGWLFVGIYRWVPGAHFWAIFVRALTVCLIGITRVWGYLFAEKWGKYWDSENLESFYATVDSFLADKFNDVFDYKNKKKTIAEEAKKRFVDLREDGSSFFSSFFPSLFLQCAYKKTFEECMQTPVETSATTLSEGTEKGTAYSRRLKKILGINMLRIDPYNTNDLNTPKNIKQIVQDILSERNISKEDSFESICHIAIAIAELEDDLETQIAFLSELFFEVFEENPNHFSHNLKLERDENALYHNHGAAILGGSCASLGQESRLYYQNDPTHQHGIAITGFYVLGDVCNVAFSSFVPEFFGDSVGKTKHFQRSLQEIKRIAISLVKEKKNEWIQVNEKRKKKYQKMLDTHVGRWGSVLNSWNRPTWSRKYHS